MLAVFITFLLGKTFIRAIKFQHIAFALLFSSLLAYNTASFAHELNKDVTLRSHIAMRKNYDMCMEKAQNRAQSEKKCRQTYAKQRLLSVEKIHHLYMQHPLEAEELYDDMLVGITGTVQRIETTALGVPEIIFALDAFGLSGVRAEFSKAYAMQLQELKIGTKIRIMGICKSVQAEGFVRIIHAEFLDK